MQVDRSSQFTNPAWPPSLGAFPVKVIHVNIMFNFVSVGVVGKAFINETILAYLP